MGLGVVAMCIAATALVVAPLSAEGPDSVSGRCWYVSARCGDDSADGRNRQGAFRTLPRALKALGPGDTLVVMPGEYYHAPLVVEGLPSTPESPIWILAEPRGEAVISAAWEEAAAGCVQWRAEGDGIYSAAHGPVLFGGWKGRFLFRYMSLADLKAARAKTRGWYGEVNGPEYGVVCHDGRVYVKLPGGEDPNGEPIILSPPFWDEPGRTPVVMVRNSPGLIIDGLRVQASGIFGIQFDPISTHAVVRNCVFEYCRAGLGLPSYSLVEWCEHTYPGFYEFSELLRQRNNGRIVTYPLVKDYHPNNYYEHGIADYAYGMDHPPTDCEFRYNFCHELFDGENLGTFDNSESHHNVYLHCYDNCIELEAWQEGFASRNLRFHDNLLLGCPSAPISHQRPEYLEGPHYVYRNVVYGYDDHGWNPWTVIKSKCYGKGNGFYYYHNLFWLESAQLYWNEKDWPQDWLKTFDFRNNIFVFTKHLERPTGPVGSEQHFNAAHNIVIALRADRPILDALLRDDGMRLERSEDLALRDPGRLDFGLTAGSPAVDAGMRIPGFNDDAIGAPDIGPFEFGRAYDPEWPRPRRTVFNANPPERITGLAEPPSLVTSVK